MNRFEVFWEGTLVGILVEPELPADEKHGTYGPTINWQLGTSSTGYNL
jgi:hypothetical protein